MILTMMNDSSVLSNFLDNRTSSRSIPMFWRVPLYILKPRPMFDNFIMSMFPIVYPTPGRKVVVQSEDGVES